MSFIHRCRAVKIDNKAQAETKIGGEELCGDLRSNLDCGMTSDTLERSSKQLGIDLSGEWLGYYTGHYDEVVRITQDGDYVEAVKITGDDYVPADEVTWRANLRSGRGEGQIAEREFRNARFVPGLLAIINEDRLVFTWENCGEVEFRRDE